MRHLLDVFAVLSRTAAAFLSSFQTRSNDLATDSFRNACRSESRRSCARSFVVRPTDRALIDHTTKVLHNPTHSSYLTL